MDQIYSNSCQLADHYEMQKDQICIEDQCQLQKMCLYCRLSHNQNHRIIPIKQLVDNLKKIQNSIDIKQKYYTKIIEIFNQIQKQVSIYIDNQLDQTNFFKQYSKFQESKIKLQEIDIQYLDQTSMKLLIKMNSYYEEDIQKKSFLNEDNKQKTVKDITDLFIKLNSQNFKQENVEKCEEKIFEELFTQAQAQLEQQYEQIQQLSKDKNSLQIQIQQLEKQIKEKDNFHNEYVQKQEQEITEMQLQTKKFQDETKGLHLQVQDIKNEKSALQMQLEEVHKYSVDTILTFNLQQLQLEFENNLQQQKIINEQKKKELIQKHNQILNELSKKIEQRDQEIQNLQKLLENQEFEDVLSLKIQQNNENKEYQALVKNQKNMQIIQLAKKSIKNVVRHFNLRQN
ncbi:hypothetical protein ABPG72_022758 [Tetrahymena utriculariae]